MGGESASRRRAWLERALRKQLGGSARAVVWVEAGDEVLVHLDSLVLGTVSGALVVRVDLEADDVGRERLVLPFALALDRASRLLAVTETPPHAGVLSLRWRETLQNALLAALNNLVDTARRQGRRRALALALEPAPRHGERR